MGTGEKHGRTRRDAFSDPGGELCSRIPWRAVLFFQVCTELPRRQRNLQSTASVVLFSLLLCGQVHVEISIQPIWPLIDLRLSAFVWTIKRRDGKEGTAKTFIDHTMLHALIVKRQVARYYVDVVYPNMV